MWQPTPTRQRGFFADLGAYAVTARRAGGWGGCGCTGLVATLGVSSCKGVASEIDRVGADPTLYPQDLLEWVPALLQ